MMMSGRIAFNVAAVSRSVSPFFTEEEDTDIFITSAPSRFPAISKEDLRTRRGLEEEVDLGPPSQGRCLFLNLARQGDVVLRGIQKRCDVGTRQAFDAEKMAIGIKGSAAH